MRIMRKAVVFFVTLFIIGNVSQAFAQETMEELIKAKNFEGLEKRGKEAVRPLILILKSEISFDRAKAAEALGKIKDKRAIDPLMYLLREKSDMVRKAAIKALENISGMEIGDNEEKWIEWYEDYKFSNTPAPDKPPKKKDVNK